MAGIDFVFGAYEIIGEKLLAEGFARIPPDAADASMLATQYCRAHAEALGKQHGLMTAGNFGPAFKKSDSTNSTTIVLAKFVDESPVVAASFTHAGSRWITSLSPDAFLYNLAHGKPVNEILRSSLTSHANALEPTIPNRRTKFYGALRRTAQFV